MLHQREQFTCPACGGFIGEAAPTAFVAKSLRRYQSDIFSILAKHIGEPVERQRIAELIYRGDANGGPLWADHAVANHVANLAKRVEPFGWTITTEGRGQGVRATCRLIPLEVGPC